jgi:predicted dinucleotide-binding enzyme
MKLAFVGGTGPEGLGLAMRFAKAGHEVAIGSRSRARATKAPTGSSQSGWGGHGRENAEVVGQADVVF